MQVPEDRVPQDLHKLITAAIIHRRRIRFWYDGKERIAEPHDYGIQNGQTRLLIYQIGGHSSSGRLPAWRLIQVSRIENLEILDKGFAGNRPAPSGQHHHWDRLFIRVGDGPGPAGEG
jgi:WYL domain